MVTVFLAALLLLFVPLAVYGAAERRPFLIGVAATLAAPVAWFAGAYPPFRVAAWFVPCLLAIAALTARAQPRLALTVAVSCAVAVVSLLIGLAAS